MNTETKAPSLQSQISNKCVHFNGIMNDCCKLGIEYKSVRVGKPYSFPCLKQGGECSKAEFLTDEQVQSELKSIEEWSDKTMTAYFNIKKNFLANEQHKGSIPCECGGVLSYSIAKINGHVWAKCSSCSISFME